MEEATGPPQEEVISQLNRSGEVLCDICSEMDKKMTAVETCLTCSSSYCEKHVRRHHTDAKLLTHTLVKASSPSPPANPVVRCTGATSVKLSWDWPTGQQNSKHSFKVTWNSWSSVTRDNRADITGLSPETEYSFSICTTDETGLDSDPVTANIRTKCILNSYLKTLGLEQSHGKELTLNKMLAINAQMIYTKCVSTPKSQLGFFLRELMKANVSARDKLSNLSDEKDLVNPLDLITALFWCSDHFLQQEIALKMSLCQFAVPLLLPNCETKPITLMLWAMRDIVKRYKTHSMDQNEFVEDSIVLANLPMVSFVRLGYSSLSKSELLNNVLSKSQQNNCSFVHRNMAGGNSPRQISDGLVEITWYFPCGNPNTDVFSEPVAVANLRGDIQDFPTQFEFLCKTSAAVFVFCDGFSLDSHVLNSKHLTDRQFFVVSNTEAKSYDAAAFELLQLKPSAHIKKDGKMNNVQLVQKLHSVVTEVVMANPVKFSVEKMAKETKKLNIYVDEDFELCQAGKENACSITDHISDISGFKIKNLPLHGQILQDLVKIEREQSKLKNAGTTDFERYKDELMLKKEELRKKQVSHATTDIMPKFIHALKESRVCTFFLKWMKINLDNLSRACLSNLKEKYKSLCGSSPVDQKALSALENTIYLSSLGTEHFLRELGQLYESAQSLPEDHPTLQQYKHLPRICAQVMLDGFPLELIDGDASYIPMKWISDVLRELHSLTFSNSKVKVITVLGVQSSGKSTLLNTMFGIQFAVSGGRCTRGAFMQLIRVEEDLKEQLGCDFIMVIDTEGLKAPQLAQLVNSYEHDNELATLVVGLSDITIINIAMENATEMKDTMQIVVHAFLRMKEVGKKHMCQFVHQNVPDCSAHAKNANDRKLLLQQLNEMTEVAAKMERKEHNKGFTDIMDYDPEKHSCYLPGLWFGNPPMAPVNAGYSDAVSELKESIIQRLIDLKTPVVSILQFCEWTENVWNAVKHENFIFSFRNSLEADAYNNISVEFNRFDWTFRNNIQVWVREAETEISNCAPSGLDTLNKRLKNDGTVKLQAELSQMQKMLDDYYKKAGKDVHFIERHKQSFVNSTKALHDDIENSVIHKLQLAVNSKRSMAKIEDLKKSHSSFIEQQVLKLLKECKSKGIQMNSEELDSAFKETWKKTVDSLDICKLETQDIESDIRITLTKNIKNKAGAFQILKVIKRLDDQSSEIEVAPGKSAWNWLTKHFKKQDKNQYEQLASSIIGECKKSIANRVESGSDYNNMDALDVLKVCDTILDKNENIDVEFEAKLKINICAHASREYQKMHKAFIEDKDPQRSLDELKPKFLDAFKDLFFERDQCEKKAEEFTKVCLEPAVVDYVNASLGPDIVKTMVHREIQGNEDLDLRTRTFFEFSLLKLLLLKDDFEYFVSYTGDFTYQQFVKTSIVENILIFFSKNKSFINCLLKEELKCITDKIEQVIKTVGSEPPFKDGETISTISACSFIDCICSKLNKDLSFPQDRLDVVVLLNNAKGPLFLDHLKTCVENLKKSLEKEFNKDMDVKAKLKQLPIKPQDVIFDDIIGCGKLCPFCKAPCEAAQPGHKEHFVTIHRPEGIGKYMWDKSKQLVTDICTSLVTSKVMFRCKDTKDEWHPYKNYRSIYPDWRIQPDSSVEDSDYWKYVFAKYNQQFADKYEAKPADIPPGWKRITLEQAMESLKKTYRQK
ncbi:interferon-induced very large GTPase 1-like [Hypomesus transpacificus]|uniref:interferon-induced very large GTPase 1-like n=1 Tax=Hypomesus transpacificus TaxID=137520 RepID=UPI001F07F795|nr:interferon-induced very large GTPase 1-like [Hypomesus transpacificus]